MITQALILARASRSHYRHGRSRLSSSSSHVAKSRCVSWTGATAGHAPFPQSSSCNKVGFISNRIDVVMRHLRIRDREYVRRWLSTERAY
jgi:hypothetical protein